MMSPPELNSCVPTSTLMLLDEVQELPVLLQHCHLPRVLAGLGGGPADD